jgi:hypothetical protein
MNKEADVVVSAEEPTKPLMPERIKPFLSDEPLSSFPWNTEIYILKHTGTIQETGLKHDDYIFVGDGQKRLRITKIEPGFSSPSQTVEENTEMTIEGHIWGEGKFKFSRADSEKPKEETTQVSGDNWTETYLHNPGDKGSWQAGAGSEPMVIFQLSIPKAKPQNIKQ